MHITRGLCAQNQVAEWLAPASGRGSAPRCTELWWQMLRGAGQASCRPLGGCGRWMSEIPLDKTIPRMWGAPPRQWSFEALF